MIKLDRTNTNDPQLLHLVEALDRELAITDGDDHEFYDQFNKLDSIKNCLVAYIGRQAVGCGALKPFDSETMEIKRMYTDPNFRGQGIGKSILTELESWAKQMGYKSCILETGINQPEAISLYKKSDYKRIPNYGQYENIENSFCFKKVL